MAASYELKENRFYGNICSAHSEYKGLRRKSNKICVACQAESDAKRHSDPENIKRKSTSDAKPEVKLRKALQRAKPESKVRCAKASAKWYTKPESVGFVTANAHAYRARKNGASLNYGDQDKELIVSIILECRKTTKFSNVLYSVDHELALMPQEIGGVCGFHVFCNLRIITASENYSKHNKAYIPLLEQWNEFGDDPVNPRLSDDSPKWA